MSIALTPAFIKRSVLIVLLAGLMFAAGFATRDADAQPGSFFIACVNNYTGAMRKSDVQPQFIEPQIDEPGQSEEVEFCQPDEEAWILTGAFAFDQPPTRRSPDSAR